jgi:hypothetical protein
MQKKGEEELMVSGIKSFDKANKENSAWTVGVFYQKEAATTTSTQPS